MSILVQLPTRVMDLAFSGLFSLSAVTALRSMAIARATTVEEAQKLGAAGFEKYDEFKGIHLYRKPKRFSKYGS
jgi:hypothetical protein